MHSGMKLKEAKYSFIMKRNSYILCLLLSLVLWALAGLYFARSKAKLKPAAMISDIQQDVYEQEQAVRSLLDNKKLMDHLWQNRLSETEFQLLASQKFIIHFYEYGKLAFWNKNNFPVSESRFLPRLTALKEGDNVFLYKGIGNAAYPYKRISIIIPIYKHYDISNEYLQPGFGVSATIPGTSVISTDKVPGASQIRSSDHTDLFYVSINASDIEPFKPDVYLLLLILGALIASVMTVQLIGIYLSHTRKVIAGIGFVFGVILITRLLIYRFGLPFNLGNLDLFSPQIFASSNILPSFGHLFLHVLGVYWLFSFVISKKSKFDLIKDEPQGLGNRRVIFIGTMVAVFAFGFYLQHLIQAIVFDSDISFDTNTFNATGKFTFLALVIIAIISRIWLLSLQFTHVIINKTVKSNKYRYLEVLIIALIVLFIHQLVTHADESWVTSSRTQNWLGFFTVIWAVIYICLIDNKYFRNLSSGSSLFSFIFLSVYFSIIFAFNFKFFIDEKEQNITRIAFAEKLSRQQDTELELKFDEIETKVKQDTILQNWFLYSDSISIQEIYKHFKLANADLYFTKYAQDFFLYDTNGHSLIHNESVSMDSLVQLKNNSIPTLNRSLFFRIDKSEQGAYLVFLPVVKAPKTTPIGFLAINFRLKQNISQSLYPHLLKSESQDIKDGLKYNYGIYINKKLANQYGNYNFDFNITTMPSDKFTVYKKKNGYSELYYKAAPNMVYVVVYQNYIIVGVITIFSFLFGIFLIITTLENWIFFFSSAWISGRKIKMIYNASMSVRVKYFALGFTAISFFIIGLSTVILLKNRYEATSLLTIEQTTANASEAIGEYLQNQKSAVTDSLSGNRVVNKEFAFFLTDIAQQQKMDINVFDSFGKLAFTTQYNLYKANVLDDNMPAHAFYTLHQKKLSTYIQPERIGLLDYTAGYAPIVNHENKLIGYLNIPSFYTKQHLDNQIFSLITTLVNIYTILLLISSIITFLFINTLTKSLRLVADSLKNVSLKNNKLINWPYKDEIGLLVDEYNKMVATVEKNARSLVLDERQNAWREMAQQVAHEIKNPLTPMKLNIQYLQQAINSNHPDIINLTKRVSSSIIEQIDNLNYIASEFSNFAKMPENKSERIDLKSMLERIVLLFAGNKNLTITHALPDVPVIVFADKSQMLRIFTNIVQNAVESIPTEERQGLVDVALLFAPNNDAVIIKVKDNGTGIREEVRDRIFDPYFTTKSSGTGLGLAMTKKIIELWDGTITFESGDEGTTFFLTVPLG